MKLYRKKLTTKFDKPQHQFIRLNLGENVIPHQKTPNSILYCNIIL